MRNVLRLFNVTRGQGRRPFVSYANHLRRGSIRTLANPAGTSENTSISGEALDQASNVVAKLERLGMVPRWEFENTIHSKLASREFVKETVDNAEKRLTNEIKLTHKEMQLEFSKKHEDLRLEFLKKYEEIHLEFLKKLGEMHVEQKNMRAEFFKEQRDQTRWIVGATGVMIGATALGFRLGFFDRERENKPQYSTFLPNKPSASVPEQTVTAEPKI